MYKYFLGIDISKDSFDVTLLKANKQLFHSKFDMDIKGFNDLLQSLASYPQDTLLITMESTGIYHLPLLSFLLDNNFNCVVVNPILIKNFISSTTLRKTKNDKLDSYLIALFASKAYHSLHLAKHSDIENIKPIIRERETISKQIAKLKTEIKTILSILFPELLHHTNVFTSSILNLLLQAPSVHIIRNLKEKTVNKILKTNGNRVKISAKEIISLANNSIAVSDKYLQKILSSKIRRLFYLQDELSFLDEELTNSLEDTDYNNDIEILQSIPGIGSVTSKNFIIEISSISNFKSVKQLCAFIGIDPSLKQSGSSVFHQGNISKRGNSYLRRTIFQMASSVIRYCDKFKSYYTKKRSEGKKYKQAVIATANKLLRTIFSLLKSKTKFDPKLA
jgi:transposase